MVRSLTLASVLALLPATASAQDQSTEAMTAKAAEAEAAAALAMPDIGLAVGAMAPEIELADSTGGPANLAGLSGEKGTVLVFFRSADWCPFCKKQLVDLEEAVTPLAEAGWSLAAVSYDPVDVLDTFKTNADLTYTLLSDPESQTIRAFNLFNDEPKEGSRFYGIPHPAIVFIGVDGTVKAMLREEDYRKRPPVETVVETAAGL